MNAATLTREALFERVLQEAKGGTKGTATARRAKALMLQGVTIGKLELVWQRIGASIADALRLDKSVHIPQIGRFGPNKADNNRPCFVLAESFARAHDLDASLRKPVQFGVLADLNISKLCIETRLPKDEVRAIVTTLFSCLGQALEDRAQAVHAELTGVGVFHGDHGRLQFSFGASPATARRLRSRRSARLDGSIQEDDDARSVASFQREAPASARSLCLTGRSGLEQESGQDDEGSRATEDKSISVPRLDLLARPSARLYTIADEEKGQDALDIAAAETFFPTGHGDQDEGDGDDHSELYAPSIDTWESSTDASGPIVYPTFYHRERRSDPLHTSVEERQQRRAQKMMTITHAEFKRITEELKDELAKCEQQDLDIARRNEMSEMAYRDKLVQMKREQLDLNEFLIKQAQERRDRDRAERVDLLGSGKIIAEEGPTAFPVEGDPDYEGAARTKQLLKNALRAQIRDKTRRQREERAHNVAEERLLIDSNIKLLRNERVKESKRRTRKRRDLQEHWRRQNEIAGMQRMLTEAKNGKIIAHTQSEAGLLTVRSVTGSARNSVSSLDLV
ncbi:Hypothetical Protein FCC1311_079502 [Hondaea fermentalgiana]|uniref:Uncharacterized protein n=1 Tax=Hondaea fermentalgiana TaxID=2315210 RepID=A0A2R5GM71_9STRA|nr:Hypothetical Protein FCC1311_079502 [Hondaea fermentalgiana]|eukprot:GBG31725.1 Hypothetical Protein FCC1311_079502 [Hondaea fermentalgiana]